MKPKTMILMVVAVACGLGASYMTSKLLANRNNNPPPVETVDVLVTTARIPSWQPIKEPEKVFTIKKYPVDVAPKKAIGKFEDVKDKSLNAFMEEGKPISEDDLVGKDMQDLSGKLMPGQRALAIKVTAETLVGGFIRPGSRVDVVCTLRTPEVSSRVILQNMLVLAVGEIDTKGVEKTLIGSTATLAATLEEGSKLALGQSMGELRLVLRRPDDQDTVSELIVRPDDLGRPSAPLKDPQAKDAKNEGSKETAKLDVPDVPKEKEEPKEVAKKGEEQPKRAIKEENPKKAETKTAKKAAPVEEVEEEEQPEPIVRPRIQLNPPRPTPTHTMYIREGSKTRKEQVATKREDETTQESDEEEAAAPPQPPRKDEKAQPRAEQPKTGPQPPAKTGSSTKTSRTKSANK